MMVKALEWGKGNPAQIAGKVTFGDALTEEEKPEDPDSLIGQFLTDLMIACRNNTEINQVLMLAQEGLYRCLIGTEIFTTFFNKSKTEKIDLNEPGALDVILCEEPRPQICTREYDPVCATLKDGSTRTGATGCTSCSDPAVVGYRDGACEEEK